MALPTMGAAPANTYMETAMNNVREDLSDIVYELDKDDTPVVTAATKSDSDQVLTEWLVQDLNPAANVPQPEGFTAAMSPAKKPQRLQNVCQILARTVAVSNTARAVAGNTVGGDEYERQILHRGTELKTDLELTILGETIKTTVDPRAMSGLQTYCSLGSVGAGAGVLPLGDGTNAHTPGTARDLTLDMVETGMQQSWDAGGKPNMAVMSSTIKRWFSNMAATVTAGNPSVASQVMQSTTPAPITIMGAVGAFLTDFGVLQLVPDRYIPAHVLMMIDTRYLELGPLPGREFVEEEYAKTGDNTPGGVVWEGCVRPCAPKSMACVWDLNQ